MKYESQKQREIKASNIYGFVEGVECAKENITNELKDAIQNGTIVISKGADKLFEIIDSIDKVE